MFPPDLTPPDMFPPDYLPSAPEDEGGGVAAAGSAFQFGGTNAVALMNIGQPGSAYAGSGAALYLLRVIEGADRARVVEQAIDQQNVAFQDQLGFAGTRVIWSGNVKVGTDAVLGTITAQLNRYKHGSSRTDGLLDPPDPRQMRPTRLTNSFGRILSERAVIDGWSMGEVSTLHNGAPYTLIARDLRIVFKLLG